MDGIYYGRFDLKCKSIELLEEGKGIHILEFNGVAGEPAHIYDPEFPVWKAYRDIYRHFKIIISNWSSTTKKRHCSYEFERNASQLSPI